MTRTPAMIRPNLKILGTGAVTTAGWGVQSFLEAVTAQSELPSANIPRPESLERQWACLGRPVPPPPQEALPKSPRLRRASPITKFILGAGLEALKSAGFSPENPPGKMGIIQVLQNGSVQYSGRFFGELQAQPTMPSPLIFPETVFNAPASHVAQCLGVNGTVTTIIGEANLVVEALLTAQQWLEEGLVDTCLVIAGEELDWLSAEAATYYHKDTIATEGAAALLLGKADDAQFGSGVDVAAVAPMIGHHSIKQRRDAMQHIASSLRNAVPGARNLVRRGVKLRHLDAVESAAWADSGLETVAPRDVIGEAMGASGALQIVYGCELAKKGGTTLVSLPGGVACTGLALAAT